MSALVVHLPPQPVSASTEFEYALTVDGSTLQSHGSAQAALLPAPTRAGAEVVAVVPPEVISWHRVELPKGTTAASPRLRSVLEGLLEDQLLDDPESLHLALQPQKARATGPVWVAACDRAWLRSMLQALEAAGRPVARIVPEFAPEGDPVVFALGEPQHPLLVASGSEGVTALPLSSQALPLLGVAADTPCVAEPAVAALAEQVLHRRPVLQQAPQRWLRSAQTAWDLAQFDFSSSGRARAFKKLGTAWADLLAAPQWRPARWGVALLVAINVVGLNAWAWRERSALEAKRESVRRTLTQTFPQVKVVVDAPAQMEKEVGALRRVTGATSGRDLEAMLGALSAASPPQRPIAGLDFAGGELRVKGLAYNAGEARSVAAAVKGQGYALAVQGDTAVMTQGATP